MSVVTISDDKDILIKHLWNAIESNMKNLKGTYENPLCTELRIKQWGNVRAYSIALEALQRFDVGKFYKYDDTNDKYLIFKVTGFYVHSTGEFHVKGKVLTCTEPDTFRYDKIADEMSFFISDYDTYRLASMEVKKEDLPLYIRNAFNGTLLREMLSESGNDGAMAKLDGKETGDAS
jgi:hypothetical protein